MWSTCQTVGGGGVDQTALPATEVTESPRIEEQIEPSRDLHMVERLLERCWREIDAAELNVKLTDIVRLLELKTKLCPSADAERTFWQIIDQMRAEELADFGDPGDPSATTNSEDGNDDNP